MKFQARRVDRWWWSCGVEWRGFEGRWWTCCGRMGVERIPKEDVINRRTFKACPHILVS